jgi:hypothetical protein
VSTPVIENSDVLQACATTLAGVLIFITLERKFEIKGESELISFLNQSVQIEADIKRKRELGDRELGRGPECNQKVLDELEGEIESLQKDLKFTNERIETLIRELNISQHTAHKIKVIKARENVATFVTILLLSASIIFMISVNYDWNFYFIDFFNVSRFLFGLSFLFLLLRIYFRTQDPSGYKPYGIVYRTFDRFFPPGAGPKE